ncbi:MAG: phosphotransferase [Synergistaceae bacterium]|nr:phosphotransferase [Synergistaceae bacterium]
MKEINIDGCKLIGTGAFGKVYRLDAETVAKVYDDPANLPLIETEQERSRRAFIKGIPTAIPFGIARVGKAYASLFELLEARNCNDFLISHPQKSDSIITEYAELVKRLHTIQSSPGEFPDTRDVYLGYLECMREYIPGELYGRLADFVRAVPESSSLVHGDIQMKNVMLSNGEMFLIDMNTISAGDAVFEIAGLYRTYIAFNEREPGNSDRFLGLNADICRKIYYRTAEICGIDPERRDIQILGWLRYLHVVIIELSSPESPTIKPTLETLRRLLDGENIH